MRLLRAVSESVLWVLDDGPIATANLRREAEVHGVSSERIVGGARLPLPQHLARHRLADLFLDTFPVCAHTTASDALWAGCPVLTLAGEAMASRVAASLLSALGLPELVTTDLETYEAAALGLARDPTRLTALRSRLAIASHASGVFDGGLFARHLESALTRIWERHIAGEAPQSFSVAPSSGS